MAVKLRLQKTAARMAATTDRMSLPRYGQAKRRARRKFFMLRLTYIHAGKRTSRRRRQPGGCNKIAKLQQVGPRDVKRHRAAQIRNPNLEIRNKSEIRKRRQISQVWRFGSFEFRVCFGFRDSDFGFGPVGTHCAGNRWHEIFAFRSQIWHVNKESTLIFATWPWTR